MERQISRWKDELVTDISLQNSYECSPTQTVKLYEVLVFDFSQLNCIVLSMNFIDDNLVQRRHP